MPEGVGYPGVEKAVAAFFGKPAIVAGAKADEDDRLVRLRNQRALLDDRLHKAAMSKMKLEGRQGLQSKLDMNDPLDIAVIAELADQMASAETARGRGQQNTARGAALSSMVTPEGTIRDDADQLSTDILNRLLGVAGDSKLTPSNVRVDDQANADISADLALVASREASGRAADARVEASRASAGLSDARRAALDPSSGGPVPFKAPDQNLMLMLLRREDPETFEVTDRTLEFNRWWNEQRKIDPAYNNGNFALIQFDAGVDAQPRGRQVNLTEMGQRNLATARAMDATDSAVTGTPDPAAPDTSATEAPPAAPVQYSQADAEAVIEAADRAIQAGKDPAAVRAILEQQLKEMGYAIGQQ